MNEGQEPDDEAAEGAGEDEEIELTDEQLVELLQNANNLPLEQ